MKLPRRKASIPAKKEEPSSQGNWDPAEDEPSQGRVTPAEALPVKIDEFFATILSSNKLDAEERRGIELAAKCYAETESLIEEARGEAAEQERTIYVCEGCGLQFIGILEFAEHDEETAHMNHWGKRIDITSHAHFQGHSDISGHPGRTSVQQ